MGILNRIFGDKKLVDLDDKIDKLISVIPPKDISSSVEDTTGKVIDSFVTQNSTDSDISKLFQDVSVPQDRIGRYNSYDEVNKAVPIVRRIVKTYIANLLPKNPVTGQSIIYRETGTINTDSNELTIDKVRNFSKDIITEYNIVKKLKEQILPRRLLYGDCFVEIVELGQEMEKVDLNKSQNQVLTELSNKLSKGQFSEEDYNQLFSVMVECEVPSNGHFNLKHDILLEYIQSQDEEKEGNKEEQSKGQKQNKSGTNFEDVLLRVHKPHSILILETKYGSRVGYLEILKKTNDSDPASAQNLTQLVSKLVTNNKKDDIQDKMVNKLIFYVLKQIIKKTKKDSSNATGNNAINIDDAVHSLGDDVYMFIKRMFVEQGLYKKNSQATQLKVRFIPVNRMVQFTNPSVDYSPYGESIIESLILPARLYMLAQLSNCITKLSRSSVARIWKLDVGSTQMHSQLIQRIKRELYNTRVSLDDLSSFKSIPKIFSDFKDMFILTKQGQTPLDVEIQPMGDASIKVADLEDARREIIALSGIPAPYLGFGDTVELREQLVHANVAFATEIVDQQEMDNAAVNKIIDTIAEIKGMKYKPSDHISISMIPPVVLILQLIEMTLSSIGNIAGVFTNMGVGMDPYFFLEQYIPHIDWKSFKEAANQRDLENRTKTQMGLADPSNQPSIPGMPPGTPGSPGMTGM